MKKLNYYLTLNTEYPPHDIKLTYLLIYLLYIIDSIIFLAPTSTYICDYKDN